MLEFERCTLSDVADALCHIDAHDRDTWIKMGMAIKAEFGVDGFDTWDQWSQTAANYQPEAAKTSWRSFRRAGAAGAIRIASLFQQAIHCGYEPKRREYTAEEKAKLAEDQAARRRRREQEEAEERAAILRWHENVAGAANQIWGKLKPTGFSKYLGAKQVKAFGLGFAKAGIVVETREDAESIRLIMGKQPITDFFSTKAKDTSFKYLKRGTVAVPLLDEDGNLCNLQFIFPTGKKSFLKHGRKSGCFHIIGAIDGSKPLVVTEGYATGASAHMATGWPVVVAFDGGNLVTVAGIFRRLYPRALMIIAGDDDHAKEGNPGEKKAIQAANDVGGVSVLPLFESEVLNA